MPSALIANRIYTPGGYDASRATSAVLEVYDSATDRWTAGPTMPEGRNHPCVVAGGGRLFVIGGYSASNAATASTFAYDPSTQLWSTRRVMPVARAAHACVELNGRVQLFHDPNFILDEVPWRPQ